MTETKNSIKWFTISGVIFILLSIFFGVYYLDFNKKNTSNIDFVLAKKGELIKEVSTTGVVKPRKDVDLGFEISGKVSEINIKVGDHVFAGQIIMRLEDSDLYSSLENAQALLAEQQARFAEIKSGTRKEEIDIQKVKVNNAEIALVDAKKDIINKLRDAYSKSDDAVRNKSDQLFSNPRSSNPELNIVISNIQLKTNLQSNRLVVEQTLMSFEKNIADLSVGSDLTFIMSGVDNNLSVIRKFLDNVALAVNELTANASLSQTVIDGYKASVWSARNNVNNAIANLTNSESKLRAALSAIDLAQNELTLKEAGATNEEIKAQEAKVQSARANIGSMQAKLANAVLVSPIVGVVTKQDASIGEIVSMNIPVVSVISDGDFEIEAHVVESDISNIKIGDTANVTLDAYREDTVFGVVVSSINPAAVVIDGVPTYKVIFSFLTKNSMVKAGMTANIDILTNKKENVIAIPFRAVKTKDGVSVVKILRDDGAVESVNVDIGLIGSDGRVEIVNGIQEGAKVVVFTP